MRVLVTGGGGFIGSHIAHRLVQSGHDVRVLDNFSTGRRENLVPIADDVEVREGDIQSYERVQAAAKGAEVIFHQAALPSVLRSVEDPLSSNASNVIGTMNVLLAARDCGVRRLIFASSSSVYGKNHSLPKREDAVQMPISPYAVSKLAGEGYCRSFTEVYGIETVTLRYFNVFGPRQDPLSEYAAVIPRFITTVLAGRVPTIYGDGEQSRDFTYVDNAVEANMLAMSAEGVAGGTFNVACGHQISLKELIASLGEITDREIEPIFDDARPGDVEHSYADVSRAEAHLGYRPVVSFCEGLKRTVEWYEHEHHEVDVFLN